METQQMEALKKKYEHLKNPSTAAAMFNGTSNHRPTPTELPYNGAGPTCHNGVNVDDSCCPLDENDDTQYDVDRLLADAPVSSVRQRMNVRREETVLDGPLGPDDAAALDGETTSEQYDLDLKDGQVLMTVVVRSERVVPLSMTSQEPVSYKKNSVIVTRTIAIDMMCTAARKRLYAILQKRRNSRSRDCGGQPDVDDTVQLYRRFTELVEANESQRAVLRTSDLSLFTPTSQSRDRGPTTTRLSILESPPLSSLDGGRLAPCGTGLTSGGWQRDGGLALESLRGADSSTYLARWPSLAAESSTSLTGRRSSFDSGDSFSSRYGGSTGSSWSSGQHGTGVASTTSYLDKLRPDSGSLRPDTGSLYDRSSSKLRDIDTTPSWLDRQAPSPFSGDATAGTSLPFASRWMPYDNEPAPEELLLTPTATMSSRYEQVMAARSRLSGRRSSDVSDSSPVVRAARRMINEPMDAWTTSTSSDVSSSARTTPTFTSSRAERMKSYAIGATPPSSAGIASSFAASMSSLPSATNDSVQSEITSLSRQLHETLSAAILNSDKDPDITTTRDANETDNKIVTAMPVSCQNTTTRFTSSDPSAAATDTAPRKIFAQQKTRDNCTESTNSNFRENVSSSPAEDVVTFSNHVTSASDVTGTGVNQSKTSFEVPNKQSAMHSSDFSVAGPSLSLVNMNLTVDHLPDSSSRTSADGAVLSLSKNQEIPQNHVTDIDCKSPAYKAEMPCNGDSGSSNNKVAGFSLSETTQQRLRAAIQSISAATAESQTAEPLKNETRWSTATTEVASVPCVSSDAENMERRETSPPRTANTVTANVQSSPTSSGARARSRAPVSISEMLLPASTAAQTVPVTGPVAQSMTASSQPPSTTTSDVNKSDDRSSAKPTTAASARNSTTPTKSRSRTPTNARDMLMPVNGNTKSSGESSVTPRRPTAPTRGQSTTAPAPRKPSSKSPANVNRLTERRTNGATAGSQTARAKDNGATGSKSLEKSSAVDESSNWASPVTDLLTSSSLSIADDTTSDSLHPSQSLSSLSVTPRPHGPSTSGSKSAAGMSSLMRSTASSSARRGSASSNQSSSSDPSAASTGRLTGRTQTPGSAMKTSTMTAIGGKSSMSRTSSSSSLPDGPSSRLSTAGRTPSSAASRGRTPSVDKPTSARPAGRVSSSLMASTAASRAAGTSKPGATDASRRSMVNGKPATTTPTSRSRNNSTSSTGRGSSSSRN